MNLVHSNGHHLLLHFTRAEAIGIANALNEVCNGVDIPDQEFQTRLGADREAVRSLLKAMHTCLDAKPAPFDTVCAWADGCSVQARCISAYGDPVDMSSDEARDFARALASAADQADAA
jgi:hypothetical protein